MQKVLLQLTDDKLKGTDETMLSLICVTELSW